MSELVREIGVQLQNKAITSVADHGMYMHIFNRSKCWQAQFTKKDPFLVEFSVVNYPGSNRARS